MSIFDEHISDLKYISHSYLRTTGWFDISHPFGYPEDPHAPDQTYAVYRKKFSGSCVEATLYCTPNEDGELVYKLRLYYYVTHTNIIVHHNLIYTEGLELMIQKYELI